MPLISANTTLIRQQNLCACVAAVVHCSAKPASQADQAPILPSSSIWYIYSGGSVSTKDFTVYNIFLVRYFRSDKNFQTSLSFLIIFSLTLQDTFLNKQLRTFSL